MEDKNTKMSYISSKLKTEFITDMYSTIGEMIGFYL